MTMMPKISKCEVDICSFNRNETCHARAVTISSIGRGRCETFCHLTTHSRDTSYTGFVGACKAQQCEDNFDLECQRREISIGYKAQGPCCNCYQPKEAGVLRS